MKKMFVVSERKSMTSPNMEQFVTFCKKAQRLIVDAVNNKVTTTGITESQALADSGISASAFIKMKREQGDIGMYMANVEKLANLTGLSDAKALLEMLEMASDKKVVSIQGPGTSLVPEAVTQQKVYAIGKGHTVIKNGKSQIVLHDLNVDIRQGEHGETIVELNQSV